MALSAAAGVTTNLILAVVWSAAFVLLGILAPTLNGMTAVLDTAQRMARVGSWSWDVKGDRWQWSEELYRIFEFDLGTKITVGAVRETIHPEDQPSFDAAFAR